MKNYFCHNCAVKLGISLPAETETLTGSEYQLEKVLKHTAPTVKYPFVSIFDSTGFQEYKTYTVSTASSGWVEEDEKGRINMTWYAGKYTGGTFENGVFKLPTDCVKVVYHDNSFKIHSFPTQQPEVRTAKCSICGTYIPYEP
jgi:hypothetical protein